MDAGRARKGQTDETMLFLRDEEQQFQRRFAKYMPSKGTKRGEGRLIDPSVRLIEAEEKIASLQRALDSKSKEDERLVVAEQQAMKKLATAKEKNAALSAELEKVKISQASQGGQASINKLLLDDYRTALHKYFTWHTYLGLQCEVMRTLLQELGGWTESNRYKIYFGYREIVPSHISDDEVQSRLAKGSVHDFKGVEDIESISAFKLSAKFKDISCQTDTTVADSPQASRSMQGQVGSELTLPSTNISSSSSAFAPLSPEEQRLLEYREKLQRLECENQRLHEVKTLLRQKMREHAIIAEKNQDLLKQLEHAKGINERVLEEYERLRESLSATLSQVRQARVPTDAASLNHAVLDLKRRYDALEQQSQASAEEIKLKMAQFFKSKYEKEIQQLRARLSEHEPMHPSDTTRIMRLEVENPLDLAHNERLMQEAADVSLASLSKTTKRPKMDATNVSSQHFSVAAEERASEQLKELQQQLKQCERTIEIQKEVALHYREMVATLTGYQIKMGENAVCECVSSVAGPTQSRCSFFFKKNNEAEEGVIDLLDDGSAREWQHMVDNFIMRHNSIPAFLAAVTLSLVEQNDSYTELSTL